jgi:hypothetical protein
LTVGPESQLAPTSTQRKFAFLLLCAPFYLNDFGFIALDGSYGIYLLDYTVRLLVLTVGLCWPLSRTILFEQIVPVGRLVAAMMAIVALLLAGTLLRLIIESPFGGWPEFGSLFRYPEIKSPTLYWLDLLPGLLVVALSEELVFRKMALSWLRAASRPNWQIVLVSATMFAFIHWASGPGNIIFTFLLGVLYMTAFLAIGRLWPLVLAHWIEDLAVYGPW